MTLSPRFEEKFRAKKVYKLRNPCISPKAWFECFGKAVKIHSFCQSQADHTMFYKHFKDDKHNVMIAYIDNIIITGDNYIEIENLKKKLTNKFRIKDLGALKFFLAMEFARSKEKFFVNQHNYVLDLLKKIGMLGCKVAETPGAPNVKLKPVASKDLVNQGQHQPLIGRPIHISHTQLDIVSAVNMMSQFMHSPSSIHFEAV
uniref:Retrovirus-related Pol polyprotein from transposon TNT 1-94 n=1 Tax=Rhizophora mucronata TaxID=61149 RepID=A0A2P2NYG8_RHIMU